MSSGALAVFAGAVLILDLRLLGGGLRDRPIAQVARDAQPWLVWAFVGLVVTGIPQLMSNSIKEYYSIYFWVKMGILLPAFIFTFTIRRKGSMTSSAPSFTIRRRTIRSARRAYRLVAYEQRSKVVLLQDDSNGKPCPGCRFRRRTGA